MPSRRVSSVGREQKLPGQPAGARVDEARDWRVPLERDKMSLRDEHTRLGVTNGEQLGRTVPSP
ncbi:MAG: hypothetical protein ACRDYA_03660 [Egibacteraceae bacterium]